MNDLAEKFCFDLEPIELSYETDEEYRKTFCRFFKTPYTDDIDGISHITDGIQLIMEQTKDNAKWREIFLKCAAECMTEDVELGICMALSFQHFLPFYRALKAWVSQNDAEFVGYLAEWKTKF